MATYVLIHGAGMGGVFWEPVANELAKQGHRVFRPTLTGCGGQAHHLDRELGLATHAQDVVALMEYEGLRDVVLVSHSYSGCVATQAAEYLKDRLARIVYCDSFLPGDGQSAVSLLPDTVTNAWQASVDENGDGFKLNIGPHTYPLWGLKRDQDLQWIVDRLCPFPYKALKDPVSLPKNVVSSLQGAYILGASPNAPSSGMFRPFIEKARGFGWDIFELPYGHFPHIEAPEVVAAILHNLMRPS